MGAEPGRQVASGECRPKEIGRAEERLVVPIETCDEDVVPQRVELGATFVEHLGQVGVQVLRIQHVSMGGVVLPDIDGLEQPINVLHVGYISAKPDHGFVAKDTQPLDVGETSQRSVGC